MIPPIPDIDLVDLALGRLDPPRREELERRLRQDPALVARLEGIRAHLARWDALPPAPPPPPFDALAPHLAPRRPTSATATATAAIRPRWALTIAALLLLALGLALGARGRDGGAGPAPAVVGRAGPDLALWRADTPLPAGAHDLEAGDRLRARRPAALDVGSRVRVVLDARSELLVRAADRVELREGRAFFEVRPGPFAVQTPLGLVQVLGTAFEVDLGGGDLAVRVESGTVEARGALVAAGERYAAGDVRPTDDAVGGWFRRPDLVLEGPARARQGEVVVLRVAFVNGTALDQTMPVASGVGRGFWLEVTDPDGRVHDLSVSLPTDDELAAADGGSLRIPAGGRVASTLRLASPFEAPGTYRCRAMYRPEGQPPLLSPDIGIEVR